MIEARLSACLLGPAGVKGAGLSPPPPSLSRTSATINFAESPVFGSALPGHSALGGLRSLTGSVVGVQLEISLVALGETEAPFHPPQHELTKPLGAAGLVIHDGMPAELKTSSPGGRRP